MEDVDVLVVGGGNAAMCAALEAADRGARVLVLESAPEHMRGGNTRHTRNIRCAHDTSDRYSSGAYKDDEFLEDLIDVTGGPENLNLAKFAIRQSHKIPDWMTSHGVNWQQPLAGTLNLGRTNRWFLGGGKALLNAYYKAARLRDIKIRYDTQVTDIIVENGTFKALSIKNGTSQEFVGGRAVIIASGGFEANIEWLRKYWGAAVDNFIVRGTPYNQGTMLAKLLDIGAKSIGDPKGFHAVAVDARAPKFDGGIVTRLDAIPFGVVVNRCALRFYDEGQNIWPKRYAIWGRLIAEQPGQIAYCIVDAETINRFLPPMYEPYSAQSLEALASILKLDPQTFVKTIEDYNRAAAGNDSAKMEVLDGVATRGIEPCKSNWAMTIDRPPFYGLPLKPGITFTYMGVTINEHGRVIDREGRPFRNIYAAGEIMAGNILTKGYLAGFGLTIGSVFGQLAGQEAALHARA
jgi:tricarballylate dehydrogenase